MIRPDYRETKHSNELYHYGMPRRSGRYPWGSGKRPFQRTMVSGNYKLEYQSPAKYKTKRFLKMFGVGALASIIPGFALIYNANVLYKTIDFKDYIKQEGDLEKLSQLKRKNATTSLEDDLKQVNPRIGNQKGTINNCVNCSVAMEMRRRGYDVRARKTANGVSPLEYLRSFKNAQIIVQKYEKKKMERVERNMPKELIMIS